MQVLPISVVIIAHNEARNIRQCLNSVKEWVDEIVLVVNDCNDGTDLIARKEYNAKIFYQTWLGFRDQKNFAIDQATHEWILSLDADEVVSNELRESIKKFFKKDANRYTGAEFPRKNWYLGRWILHGDWYPDRCLRLFQRTKSRWTGGAVHEKLELVGPKKRLAGNLEHHSYESLSAHIKKMLVYSDLFNLPKDASEKQRLKIALMACTRPLWTFFRAYILKRGFCDGFPGFCVAFQSAFATYLKYATWYEKILKNRRR